MTETAINRFWDCVSPDLIQTFSVNGMPYTGKSKYQSIQILDSPAFGRCLILDGKIQCSESDEFVYHEAMVHPPMIAHPKPETVFVAGGSEGATLREVLAHKTVKRVYKDFHYATEDKGRVLHSYSYSLSGSSEIE